MKAMFPTVLVFKKQNMAQNEMNHKTIKLVLLPKTSVTRYERHG